MIFLVLYQSPQPDFQPLESSSAGLITLSSLRPHTELGPDKGSMHVAECVCCGPWGQLEERLQFSKAEAACPPH